MYIVLQHRPYGTDPDTEPCVLCERDFEVGSVYIQPVQHGAWLEGPICPTCLKWLHRRATEEGDDVQAEWVTPEDYEEACRKYPEPIFATSEETTRAEKDGSIHRAYADSWLGGYPE